MIDFDVSRTYGLVIKSEFFPASGGFVFKGTTLVLPDDSNITELLYENLLDVIAKFANIPYHP